MKPIPQMATMKEVAESGIGRVVARKRQSKPAPSPIDGTTGQLMVMAAHRYCLGRQSYIVGACIEWLRAWWPSFEKNTQNVIVRDTVEALMEKIAGSEYDEKEWKYFAEWAWKQLDEDSRRWCQNAVAFKGKPWPLTTPHP